jgi:hypothetical protein
MDKTKINQYKHKFADVIFPANVWTDVFTEVIDFVISTFSPEEIYDEADLEDWAESNGWVKKDV